ncbi:MAG: hypothetical protein Q8908_05535, partial [Bacteroidota bacterium]|nr:hypothetical protein [Bacteroidota bacterium]
MDKRHSGATPANLTRLSIGKRQAILDSPVSLSLAPIRSKPYAVLACPDLPSKLAFLGDLHILKTLSLKT